MQLLVTSSSDNSQDSAAEADEDADTIVVDLPWKPTSQAEPDGLRSPVSSGNAPERSNIQQPLSPIHNNDGGNPHQDLLPAVSLGNPGTSQYTITALNDFALSADMPTPNNDQDPGRSPGNANYQGQGMEAMEDLLMDMDIPNLDFFDPFLGSTYDNFALPALPDSNEFLSPLEQRSDTSSVTIPHANFALGTMPNGPEISTRNQQNAQRDPPATSGTRAGELIMTSHDKGTSAAAVKNKTPLFDEEAHAHTWTDLCSRLDASALSSFRLPTAALMRKWLRVYVDAFHVHFPFIHLPTLDFTKVSSPLTLAICAIGALYRLNRSAAVALHVKAVQCLDALEVNIPELILKQKLLHDWTRPTTKTESMMSRPLWHSQARLLSLMFATFSGDPLIVRKSFQDLGILSSVIAKTSLTSIALTLLQDYRMRLIQVKPKSSDRRLTSWNVWVERESSKRQVTLRTFVTHY